MENNDKKNDRESLLQKTEKFLSGKGFYIVLFLCVAVIGVSAWIILYAGDTVTDPEVRVTLPVTDNMPNEETTFDVEDNNNEETDVNAETEDDTEVAVEVPEDTDEEVIAEVSEPLTFTWPVAGEVIKSFSGDALVYNKTMGDWRIHTGIDLSAEIGTKVLAVARGTVEVIYDDPLYGTTLVLDHGDGLKSIYSNLAGTPAVNTGDTVGKSDIIGAVGDTAIASASEVSHVHLAMKENDEYIDPAGYLPER
jgi:murein DD-endopeptidase MepM/ murein hydrolase activator NlpD